MEWDEIDVQDEVDVDEDLQEANAAELEFGSENNFEEKETESFAAHENLQQDESADQLFFQQMSEISKMNPQIKGFEDLCRMPEFEKFDQFVMQGQDLVSAYKLLQFDEMQKKQQDEQQRKAVYLEGNKAGRQTVMNNIKSKAHLTKTQLSGQGMWEKEIPTNAKGIWEEIFPDDNAQKLRQRYNKTIEE